MMDKTDLYEFRTNPSSGFRLAHAGKRIGDDPDYRHDTRTIDSWEIIVVDKGRLYMREGRQKYVLEPGSMLLLEPGREHGGYQEHHVNFFWVHFFAPAFRKRKFSFLQVLKENRATNRGAGICIPKHYTFKKPRGLFAALNAYLECTAETRVYKNERLLNRFLEILFNMVDNLLEQATDTVPVRDAQVHHVWRIMQFLGQHYARDLSISKVAAWAGLNRDYANRIFKTANGCSIQEYLIQKRIEAARDLIENAALTIAEVAARVGYEDPYYFSRIFKKKTRVSPQQYREIIYKTRNK